MFHKAPKSNSSSSGEDSVQDPPKGQFGRMSKTVKSLSPKKSVRFRSQTYTCRESQSSPIDVPQRSAPVLPPIEMPKPSFGALMDDTEPILTARPPDTPLLEARVAQDYFSERSVPEAQSDFDRAVAHKETGQVRSPLPGIDLSSEDPFDDAAAVTDEMMTALPQRAPSRESYLADLSLVAQNGNPFSSSRDSSSSYSEPDVEVGSQRGKQSTKLSRISEDVSFSPNIDAAKDSKWTLESRQEAQSRPSKWYSAEDDDAGSEDSATSELGQSSLRDRPTHEEIRQRRFKRRSSKVTTDRKEDVESASPPDLSPEMCQVIITPARRVGPKRVLTPSPKKSPYRISSLNEKNSIVVTNLTTDSDDTDPPKQSPQSVGSKPEIKTPAKLDLLPENCVSPLNLKATVSSTSPPRTRKPFRFSNKADTPPSARQPSMESVDALWRTKASPEWRTKTSPETIKTVRGQPQTPSPSLVPMPLSVASAKQGDKLPWQDEYGWSPLDNKFFPYVFLAAREFHYLLRKQGGFNDFWEAFMEPLDPNVPGPRTVTRPLTEKEIEMLERQSMDGKTRLSDTEHEQVAALPQMVRKRLNAASQSTTAGHAHVAAEEHTPLDQPVKGTPPSPKKETHAKKMFQPGLSLHIPHATQTLGSHLSTNRPDAAHAVRDVRRSLPGGFSPYATSNTNYYAPLEGHGSEYSGEVSTVAHSRESLSPTHKHLDEELREVVSDAETTRSEVLSHAGSCTESECELCKSVRGSQSSEDHRATPSADSYDSDMTLHESAGSEISEEEVAACMLQTPTRIARDNDRTEGPDSPEKTPKQKDFGTVRRTKPQVRKRYANGGSSTSTSDTTAGMYSEDERLAHGIV